jgi:RNA polymerase sigma-70 factor (ECF subfamily)
MQERPQQVPLPAEQEAVALYQECSAGLLRYAESMTHNHEEARDAVQEAFLRYFTERRFGRHIEHPRAWLCRVMRNFILTRLNSAAQREVAADNLDTLPDGRISPEARLQNSQLSAQIAAVLNSRERHCLSLRAQGMDYAQIAEHMGVRPGTVGSLLTRIHDKLQQLAECAVPMNTAEALQVLFVEAGDSH